MTPEQIRRTKQALNETHHALNKELTYSQHLQKQNMIAFYRDHIAKLTAMLQEEAE